MALNYTFRFLDDRLNRSFQDLVSSAGVHHDIDDDGVLHYSENDVELVENELLRRVRSSVFPIWQLISCPEEWADSYKKYMVQHDIPFTQELIDGQTCFLLPRKHRPHSWKLQGPEYRKMQPKRGSA